MKKENKIIQNYRQEEKYRYKLKDLCRKYANHEITFGIILDFLRKRKIIKLENDKRK